MASDLGLHCLHMSHKKDVRLIWVKSLKNGSNDCLNKIYELKTFIFKRSFRLNDSHILYK